jgi:spermidine dehydrogenase
MTDRELGMDRRIARRDFLNGVAISAAAFSLRGAPIDLFAQGAAEYPPALTALRGNYPDAVSAFGPMGQGAYRQFPALDADMNETYDLVIVGAGISGLAAAHFWRRALGANQKILILDNHDDFGGHAKRNEFTYQGRTFIGYGGTQSIATPFPYSYTAKRLVEELTIQVERNGEFQNRGPLGTLGPAMFFDREHFGEDRLVPGNGRLPWPEFFAKAPLSDAARADLIRIYGKNPDYMAGMTAEQKIAKLATISWQDFLIRYAKMTPEALPFFLGQGGRNNKRVDTTPALEAAERGSVGFNGLGLKFEEAFRENSYTFHFPDGNASIARLLVNRLIPAVLPGQQTMETIVQAPMKYDRLDDAKSDVRIRLKSTVVRIEHDLSTRSRLADPDRAQTVRVAYRRDGKIHGVRGRRVILACYNSLIPSLVPELPAKQKDALAYSVKVPMMYNNVLIRRWTAFQKLGVSNIAAPGMYHTSCGLDPGTSIGGYRGVTTAEEPIIVRMVRNPNKPGLPRREQHRAGQQELLSMSFEQFEVEIRRQLGRMLGGGGFDPATDIVGITVNRWPHGYSYTYDTLADPDVAPEERPHVVGRRRFGRIAIANSDAGAAAFTNQAIDEANRAVEELFVAEGLA